MEKCLICENKVEEITLQNKNTGKLIKAWKCNGCKNTFIK